MCLQVSSSTSLRVPGRNGSWRRDHWGTQLRACLPGLCQLALTQIRISCPGVTGTCCINYPFKEGKTKVYRHAHQPVHWRQSLSWGSLFPGDSSLCQLTKTNQCRWTGALIHVKWLLRWTCQAMNHGRRYGKASLWWSGAEAIAQTGMGAEVRMPEAALPVLEADLGHEVLWLGSSITFYLHLSNPLINW